MGDRANIAIITERAKKDQPKAPDEQVWLYSHWGGSELWERLQEGLRAAKPRWEDDSYCARIIICHAIPEDSIKEETGYGISTHIQDNSYQILVVDIPEQRVFLIDEDDLHSGKVPRGFKPHKSWTFEEYLELKKDPRK